MTTPLSQEQRLRLARYRMLQQYPFFGHLALSLDFKIENNMPTSGVTPEGQMLYNEEFTAGLKLEPLIGLVAHEVCHLAFGTFRRRGQREPLLWNIATDFCNNNMLRQSGVTLPPNALTDNQDISAEHRYIKLLKSMPKMQPGSGFGRQGGCCDHKLHKGKEQNQGAEDIKWCGKIAQAAQKAKEAGKLPGSLEQYIKELLEPVVPWQDELRRFKQTVDRDDYTWKRPSRRATSLGIYLPSLKNERPRVVVAIDISGSCQDIFLRFVSELNAILTECGGRVRAITVDTVIHSDKELKELDEVHKVKFTGGGTDFTALWPLLEKSEEPVPGLIFLTDLHADGIGAEPTYPVLWVCPPAHGNLPWGELITIPEETKDGHK